MCIRDRILEAGKDEGLIPAGLGARDTLRFEASLPLYGHELNENITPLEAGLGFFVKLNKENFIGKEALARQKSEDVYKRQALAQQHNCNYELAGQIVFLTTLISPFTIFLFVYIFKAAGLF